MKIFDTVGFLDDVQLRQGGVVIKGWVAAVDPQDTISGLRVSVAGHELSPIKARFPLPSPDVEAVFPSLKDCESCRFEIVADLPERFQDQDIFENVTVILTPLSEEQVEGKVLVRFVNFNLPTPDRDLLDMIGNGDFLSISAEFLGGAVQKGGLHPNHKVLEVGCGCGRMALGMACYLSREGSYDGFDIIKKLINWDVENISRVKSNFNFKWLDLYNKEYNPQGSMQSSDLVFPYADGSFDYVYLTSVFTHMYFKDIKRYLGEIARVLKPGGRCLFTCYLLNEEARHNIACGVSAFNLVHPVEEGFTCNPDVPEDQIGFDEGDFKSAVIENKFDIAGVYYGSWCGRRGAGNFQDLVVVERRVGMA
jgi:SAM-dependent methyltransferase